MLDAWNKYAEKIKGISPRLESIIISASPVIENNFKILCEFSSPLQIDTFNKDVKTDILQYLRDVLKSDKIEIEVKKSILSKGSDKPYSSKEKLEFLIDKNPILKKLSDNFDLEII